ncbi:hypothetical protein [Dermacoccus sp. PE3]|uniref:hypothetical protein n=1 Tax=Dermacoccus sp. PE3 TaxID=1641401 RepID=UPI000B2FE3B3|nr:hypothetical protein [Dermacoccus sp. PE3]
MGARKQGKFMLPEEFDRKKCKQWTVHRVADGRAFLWEHATDGTTVEWTFDGLVWAKSPTASHRDDEFRLYSDRVVEIKHPGASEVLSQLEVVDDGEPEDHDWTFKVAKFEDDDDLENYEQDSVRYVTVNKRRVCFMNSEGEQAVFLVEYGDPVAPGLASCRWGSEEGMMSGAGSTSLFRIAPDMGLIVYGGDVSDVASVVTGDEVSMVQAWVDATWDVYPGAGVAIAIELEDFDPEGTLDHEMRERWAAAFEEVKGDFGDTFSASIALGDVERNQLRAQLAQDSTYARVREALRCPSKDDGRALLAGLEDGDVAPFA